MKSKSAFAATAIKTKFVVVFAVALAATGAQANLVQNSDFEFGDLTHWSAPDTDQAANWFVTAGFSFNPYAGNYYASTGCVPDYCRLNQNLTTVAGATYALSFAFNPGQSAGGGNGDTQVYWNGNVVLDINGGDLGWSVYTVNSLLATSTSTDLTFSSHQRPAYNGLDNVSVSATATPLPSTWLMLLSGFVGLGFFAYRGSKKRPAAIAAA